MRTVDITIEDSSFADLDAVSRAAGLTPAEFISRATAAAVRLHKARQAIQRDLQGYSTSPLGADEFILNPEDLKCADNEAW